MRDYSGIVMNLRLLAADLETAYDSERGESLYSKAADAIEELLAAVPHWISVEERLPEKHQVVLFYIPWNKSCMIGWRDESGQIRLEGYGGVYERSLIKPSHWMPLPESPKEELNEV